MENCGVLAYELAWSAERPHHETWDANGVKHDECECRGLATPVEAGCTAPDREVGTATSWGIDD
eukprot:3996611-Prymnesium_polylepis.2